MITTQEMRVILKMAKERLQSDVQSEVLDVQLRCWCGKSSQQLLDRIDSMYTMLENYEAQQQNGSHDYVTVPFLPEVRMQLPSAQDLPHPACFGLPAYRPTHDACDVCKHRAKCHAIAEAIKEP